MKVCKNCGTEKPYSEFNKLKASKDGYAPNCRECTNKKRKAYKEKHKEDIKKSYKKYYNKNKETLKQKSQTYRAENREAVLKKMREYYKENKEDIKKYARDYYENKKRNNLDPSYSKKERDNEFFNTLENKGGYEKVPYSNRNILTFQPHFYEREKELWKDPNIKRYIYTNREKYINKGKDELNDREILRAFKISGKHYGFSHFSPYWIKAFIEEFNVKSIYDPCGGWGHRLLGAWDINYIYNDIDERTYRGVSSIFEEYREFNKKEKKFYNEDASSFSPKEQYEAVFTCPPYFDTEIYTCKNTSTNVFANYRDWLTKWWDSVIKNCSPETYFAFVISEKYMEDMTNIVIHNNYKVIKNIPLGKAKSHYTNGKSEFLVVLTHI